MDWRLLLLPQFDRQSYDPDVTPNRRDYPGIRWFRYIDAPDQWKLYFIFLLTYSEQIDRVHSDGPNCDIQQRQTQRISYSNTVLNILFRNLKKYLLPWAPSWAGPCQWSKHSSTTNCHPSLFMFIYWHNSRPSVSLTTSRAKLSWGLFWLTAQVDCHRGVQACKEAESTVR